MSPAITAVMELSSDEKMVRDCVPRNVFDLSPPLGRVEVVRTMRRMQQTYVLSVLGRHLG
jgi:hypothetical protein